MDAIVNLSLEIIATTVFATVVVGIVFIICKIKDARNIKKSGMEKEYREALKTVKNDRTVRRLLKIALVLLFISSVYAAMMLGIAFLWLTLGVLSLILFPIFYMSEFASAFGDFMTGIRLLPANLLWFVPCAAICFMISVTLLIVRECMIKKRVRRIMSQS